MLEQKLITVNVFIFKSLPIGMQLELLDRLLQKNTTKRVIMKAFLSHSSYDKNIVEQVADELGRQMCIFDSHHFQPNDTFKDSIKKCLDLSALFVLFLSKKSINSSWVKFEINEASKRIINEKLKKILIYIIDDSSHHDAPEWCRDQLISNIKNPKLIARDIRKHIDLYSQQKTKKIFIGRTKDMQDFEQKSSFREDGSIPYVFAVMGLPGIGRRTLLKEGSRNILGLEKIVEISIDYSDSIQDVCLKIANIAEPVDSQNNFENLFKEIKNLTDQIALNRCLKNIKTMNQFGELLVFKDDANMLNSDGYLSSAMTKLVDTAIEAKLYIGFVIFRMALNFSNNLIPIIKLAPLSFTDSKRLIERLALDESIEFEVNNLENLIQYTNGHPHSIYYSIQQIKLYGIETLLNDKRVLIEFQRSVFLKHLTENLTISKEHSKILSLLAIVNPIPFEVIVQYLKSNTTNVAEDMRQLIDLMLIEVTENGLYKLPNPIINSVMSLYPKPTSDGLKLLTEKLSEFLSKNEGRENYLDLNRALFKANRLSGFNFRNESSIFFASDIIALAERAYHDKDYESAIAYGRLAVQESPFSEVARNCLIKAFIQQKNWDEANIELIAMEKFSNSKEVFFLRGFMYRKQGNFSNAIIEFENAISSGRKGMAIYREISECCFHTGEYTKAKLFLNKALQAQPDNRFLIDLWIKISIALKDEQDARLALKKLAIIDQKAYYLFRKSRVDSQFGYWPEALDSMISALEALTDKSVPFSFYAHTIDCYIHCNNIPRAEYYLNLLIPDSSSIKLDVKTGLLCRLELLKSKPLRALILSKNFIDSKSIYCEKIRLVALKKLSQTEELERNLLEELNHLDAKYLNDININSNLNDFNEYKLDPTYD